MRPGAAGIGNRVWRRVCLPAGIAFFLLPPSRFPLLAQQPIAPPAHGLKLAHTYSIVAWDSVTGDLGVAVQSKFPNVGGIVPWARAGVGAVATQSLGNTAYGERGSSSWPAGATAEEAMRIVMRTDYHAAGPAGRHGGRARATPPASPAAPPSTGPAAGWARRPASGRSRGGKGAVIVGRGLRRPGQHHGLRPDGEEHGGGVRALHRAAGGPV